MTFDHEPLEPAAATTRAPDPREPRGGTGKLAAAALLLVAGGAAW